MIVCCVRTGRTLFGFGFCWVLVRAWLGSDLVNGLVGLISASQILGLLGLYKVRSGWVVAEFGLSAKWSGYSWVGKSELFLAHDY